MSRNIVIASVVVFVAVAGIVFVLVSQMLDDNGANDVPEDEIAFGESIYRQQCAGCHTIDGSDSVGPTLEGLYGSEVEMDDGSTVVVDEDHLYEAITDPRSTTREGFPDVMPQFDQLDDDDISSLVAFIRSLE